MARTESLWEIDSSGSLIPIDKADADVRLPGPNNYLNFGSFSGSSGYGFRDNGGNMEFKDSGGSWTDFGSGGGASLTVEEEDGSPSVGSVDTIQVSNGTLTDDGSGTVSISTGGGSTSPAGSDGAVQFNDSSSFGADATNFLWDDADNQLELGGAIQLSSITDPTYEEGQLWYSSDTSTLNFRNDRQNTTLNIGEENWIRVRNESGSQISDGSVVYISGFSTGSGLPTIQLAQADSEATASVAGVTTESIPDTGAGMVTTFGLVRNVDTSSFSAGDTLFLSPSVAGGLTSTEPSSPNFNIRVGKVSRSDAAAGQILVGGPDIAYTSSDFDTDFGNKDTGDLTEGSNLYYTNERVDDRVNNLLAAGTGISLSYDDAGDNLTITNTGSSSTSGNFSGVEATRDTTFSVANNTATNIDWDGELFDTDTYHSTSTNTSRLTVPNAGKYLIGGTVEFNAWSSLSDGRLQVRLFKNGSFVRELIDNEVDSSGGDGPSYSFQTVVDAAASDYFELNVLQASGGSRDLTTNSVFFAARLQGSGPSQLSDLNDVTSINYTAGRVLRANGSEYVSAQLNTSDLNNDANFFDTAGDGLSSSGSTVNTDITNATSLGSSVAGSDEILVADADDSNNIKKTTAQDIADLASSTNATKLVDGSGNDVVLTSGSTTPVNEITVSNADTGSSPSISATGDDSNIDINLSPKGTFGDVIVGGGIEVEDGSVSGPSISFSNEDNTGFWRQSSDILGVAVGSNEEFRFTGSGISMDGGTTTIDSSELNRLDGVGSDLIEENDIGTGLEVNSGTVRTEEKITLGHNEHKQYASGLSNEELARFSAQSGETIVVERIYFTEKGGGTSNSSASIRVQDVDASTTVGSTDLNTTTKDAGSAGTGNTIAVQVTNSTGSSINAQVTVVIRVQNT